MSENLCKICATDKPWGCNTSIRDMEVVKGIGVINCKRYIRDEKKAKWYGR